MQRTFVIPLALLAVMLMIVVSGQVGVTGGDWAAITAGVLRALTVVGWPLLAAAAWFLWNRTRQPAVAMYASALTALALSVAGGVIAGFRVGVWTYPLYLIGCGAAALLWGSRGRVLSGVFAGLLVLAAADHYYFLLTLPSAASPALLGLLNGLRAVYWLAVAAVSWLGYLAHRRGQLLWLGAQAALASLPMIFAAVSLLWPEVLSPWPGLVWRVVAVLPLGMAAGVIWSAWRDPA